MRDLLNRLFRRAAMDRDLHDEIESHIAMRAERNRESGMDSREALEAARRQFGNPASVRETVYEFHAFGFVETLVQDLRHAARSLIKNPGFTAGAVLSLALGIGANCAIFSIVNAALLKDLPVKEPRQVARVAVYSKNSMRDISYPRLRDLTAIHLDAGELAASGGLRLNRVRIDDQPEDPRTIDAAFVSPNFFSLLGIDAAAGRFIEPQDSTAPGEGAVAVIGYGFWNRRFHRDPAVVGRTIALNGTSFTIIGVAPRGFFGERVGIIRDIWIPILMQPRVQTSNMLERPTSTWFNTLIRLRPGITDSQANQELSARYREFKVSEIAAQPPNLATQQNAADFRVEVQRDGLNILGRQLQRPLNILSGVVALVLLIACCNVANLLLARGARRQHEMSIRLSMGCGRPRLVRQILTESMLLAGLGGLTGVLLAYWSSDILIKQFPIGLIDLGPDSRMLLFTLFVSIATGLLVGLVPAFRVSSVHSGTALQAASGHSTATRRSLVINRTLVVAQVALSLWVLVGAALLVRTIQNLRNLEIGFDRSHLVSVEVVADASLFKSSQARALRQQLTDRFLRIPGVQALGLNEYSLFTRSASTSPIRVPGSKVDPATDRDVRQTGVSSTYFEVVGMNFAAGRPFTPEEVESGAKVAVINETMARSYFGNENPIGRMIYFPKVDTQGRYIAFSEDLSRSEGREITGVVRDAKIDTLRGDTPRMTYLPVEFPVGSVRLPPFVLRISSDPENVLAAVQQAVRETDADLYLAQAIRLEDQIDNTLGQERLFSKLLGLFSTLALILAGVGLYGVISYGVVSRTNEIGLRIALGAPPRSVVWLMLREAALMLAVGTLLGIPAALASTRLLKNLLFGVSTTDPATVIMASLMMGGVALLAGLIPAWRASRVDATVALRCN